MLEIQKYLYSGKTLNNLKQEFGIVVVTHTTLPLIILNYHQIDSKPKTHPIVRECRSLLLNKDDWSVVAKSMNRFFNYSEVQNDPFDWESAITQEKVDGSLVTFYYYDGSWHVNTRGSFAQLPIFNNEYDARYFNLPVTFTWEQAICKALGINGLSELNGILDPKITYTCELCSLWNQVVRKYPEPCVYNLTCFDGEQEIGPIDTKIFRKLNIFPLKTADDCVAYANNHPDATFEGVVVKDNLNRRLKIKNLKWLALSRIKGNGDNLYLPKNLIPFVLAGEGDELKATLFNTYPQVIECFNDYKERIVKAYNELEQLWQNNWQIENQKNFALKIVGKTKFTSILFNIRKKYGKDQSIEILRNEWNKSEAGILKQLF